MILEIYSVYDSKAKAFIPPFFLHNKDVALRHFTDTVNDKNSSINKNPGDYALFYLGIFDDNTGEFSDTLKEVIANGIELITIEQPT